MPGDDEEKHGRIRDHICFIASVTEQQLLSILTRRELKEQQQNLSEVISMVHSKFTGLMSLLDDNRKHNEEVFRSLQEQFENRIPTMGLDEDQEVFIFTNVDEAIQNSVAREGSIAKVRSAFTEIEADLSLINKK